MKESNRLETVAELLRAIGGHVRATARRLGDPGRARAACAAAASTPTATTASAMLGAIAGLVSRDGVRDRRAPSRSASRIPASRAEVERLAVRPW